jgi:tetratricopeptide (TPR) repeat protein
MGARRWVTALAAAVVLAAVALSWLLFWRPADPSRLAGRYIRENLAGLPVKMGGADSMQTGISLYNDGRLADALQQFENVLRLDSLRPAALLDAGIVSLRMGNYDQALDYFITLENHTDPHVNPALFYEALALMKRNHAGDADHAKQLLTRIVQEDLNKRRDAQELLSNM